MTSDEQLDERSVAFLLNSKISFLQEEHFLPHRTLKHQRKRRGQRQGMGLQGYREDRREPSIFRTQLFKNPLASPSSLPRRVERISHRRILSFSFFHQILVLFPTRELLLHKQKPKLARRFLKLIFFSLISTKNNLNDKILNYITYLILVIKIHQQRNIISSNRRNISQIIFNYEAFNKGDVTFQI